MIAEMLNDEKKRLQYKEFLDLTFITDPDILKIVKLLMEDEFKLQDIYDQYGKELLVKAMAISNSAIKLRITTTGKA